MLEVIICLVLHCVMSLVLKYCYDEEKIWHNDEIAPNLHMPKLHDLDENCSVYDQQRYVEKVIIPAHNYFSAVSDIEASQNNEPLLELMCWTPTFLLVVNAFRKTQITPYIWLNIVIAIVVYALIILLVSAIYNRTRLKLGTFKLSVSDIEKRYHDIKDICSWEFDLSEENALNNFIIESHHSYISCVKHTIDKRYRVKKVVEAIAGWIYILFIWRIPN